MESNQPEINCERKGGTEELLAGSRLTIEEMRREKEGRKASLPTGWYLSPESMSDRQLEICRRFLLFMGESARYTPMELPSWLFR